MAEKSTPVTVAGFRELCLAFLDQRAKKDDATAALKVEETKLRDLEGKLLMHMEETEQEQVHIPGRGKIHTVDRFTVPVPKNMDDKKAFFKHLTERGIFFEMASVNSQTLNSFYKSEMEAAIARGDSDFKLPGIAEPSHIRTLSVRKES